MSGYKHLCLSSETESDDVEEDEKVEEILSEEEMSEFEIPATRIMCEDEGKSYAELSNMKFDDEK